MLQDCGESGLQLLLHVCAEIALQRNKVAKSVLRAAGAAARIFTDFRESARARLLHGFAVKVAFNFCATSALKLPSSSIKFQKAFSVRRELLRGFSRIFADFRESARARLLHGFVVKVAFNFCATSALKLPSSSPDDVHFPVCEVPHSSVDASACGGSTPPPRVSLLSLTSLLSSLPLRAAFAGGSGRASFRSLEGLRCVHPAETASVH